MPHPESEHGLRVQLATALRERDDAREGSAIYQKKMLEQADELVALRAEVTRLRKEATRFIACDRCSQGVMDADNPHHPKKQLCSCSCHNTARRIEALAAANAKADAAVAEIVNEQRRFGEMQREAWKLEEALAAARRECEALRAALDTIRRGGGGMDPLGRMEMSRIARDALAAPADGEEGK